MHWVTSHVLKSHLQAPIRRTILCLYIPGFQRNVFKRVKMLERPKETKEKKNKGSVFVVESVYN